MSSRRVFSGFPGIFYCRAIMRHGVPTFNKRKVNTRFFGGASERSGRKERARAFPLRAAKSREESNEQFVEAAWRSWKRYRRNQPVSVGVLARFAGTCPKSQRPRRRA